MVILTVATAEEVTVPETITIDGKEISIKESPELQALVKSVITSTAKIEKNKLYTTIENNKKALAELRTQVEQLTTAVPTVTAPQTVDKKITLPEHKPGEPITKEMLIAVVEKAMGEMQNKIEKKFEDKISPVIQQQVALEKGQIEAYRTKKLSELGDTIIPELVNGKTVAEIDSSIESSKAARARYTDKPAAPGASSVVVKTPVINSPGIRLPLVETPTASDMPEIKKLTAEEFAKQRGDLLIKLKTEADAIAM